MSTDADTNTKVEPGTSALDAATREAGDRYVARMDEVDSMPGTAEARRRSYQLLAPTPGTTVVDVGCGPGLAVAELAELGVRAVGVDLNARVTEVAAERHPAGEFRVGDVFQLPLSDSEAAGYRADKLYHLIPDQQAALAEARRVLAPGGRIVLAGPQWTGISIDADDPALTRRIVQGRAALFPDADFTTRAHAELAAAGFTDVAVEAQTAFFRDASALPLLRTFARIAGNNDVASLDEAAAWIADQEERAARGRLLFAFPVWFTSGVRP